MPDIENKYILGLHCNLWSKTEDINKVMTAMKNEYKKKDYKYRGKCNHKCF